MTPTMKVARHDGPRNPIWTMVAAVAVSAYLVAPGPLLAQRPHGEITEWQTPTYTPYDIEVGDDGYLWLTDDLALIRFDPRTGSTLAYLPLGTDKQFWTLDRDADGSLWIADENERIFRFMPGAPSPFTTFDIPGGQFPGGCGPFGVTVGPGGNIWFACQDDKSLGRLDPSGPTFTRFLINGARFPDRPMEIAFDPDGVAWFTMRRDAGFPGFGWLDPAQPTTPNSGWHTSVASFERPVGIIYHDGYLWLADHSWDGAEGQLVRIDPVTRARRHWDFPDNVDDVHFLVAGRRGRLYATGFTTSSIAVFDPPTETFQTVALDNDGAWPMGITADGDQRIWWAEVGVTAGVGGVGRFTPWGPDALAVGVLESISETGQGAVATLYGESAVGLGAEHNQLWSEQTPGIDGEAGFFDAFGSTLASGDFNGDGATDLAIGVPQEDLGAGDEGEVHILYGSHQHLLSAAGHQLWNQGSTGMQDEIDSVDEFGGALVVGDFNRDGYDDLAIGVPGESVGSPSKSGAGAVAILFGSSAGLTSDDNEFWYQGKLGIFESPEEGDGFGSVLVAGDFDGDDFDDLAIGVPDEDVAGLDQVGVVQVLYGSLGGLHWSGDQLISQDTTGVQGVGASLDRFGAALAAGDFDGDGFDDLAVGIPGEPRGSSPAPGAGAVGVFYGTGSGLDLSADQLVGQDLLHISDIAEPNDQFGSALATGDFDGNGYDDLAIGVPGETLGSASQAGAVNVLYGTSSFLATAGSQFWHQNTSGISGVAESFDRFGHSLATGDFDDDGFDDLIVGVPLEAVLVSTPTSGAGHVLYGFLGGLNADRSWLFHQNSSGVLDSVETQDAFGLSLTTLRGLADSAFYLFADGFDLGDTGFWSP